MVIYNVLSNGPCNQLVIELINDSIYIDEQSVQYISGNINIDISEHPLSNKLKSYIFGKSIFKPKFRGTGKIYLNATLGSYHKFSLKDGEELYLHPKVFTVCRDSISITPKINLSLKNFLSGVPILHMFVKGNGSVMILMPGPIQEQILNDEKFLAIGHEIAAYSPQLKVTREIIGKTWLSDPKMARVFRGKGKIFFCPIPNKDARSRIAK